MKKIFVLGLAVLLALCLSGVAMVGLHTLVAEVIPDSYGDGGGSPGPGSINPTQGDPGGSPGPGSISLV